MNHKILVAFIASSLADTEIDNAITKFTREGYSIQTVDLSECSISVLSLPSFLESVHAQYGNQIDVRMAVLSDVPHLIFAWYRCYNSLADDFIYVMPQTPLTRRPILENTTFFTLLWNFAGIERETVQGKIYLNLSPSNCGGIISFLLSDNLFRYFDHLDNFPTNSTVHKVSLNKVYLLSGARIPFGEDSSSSVEMVDLNHTGHISLPSIRDMINHISHHKYFAPYLMVGICCHTELDEETKWDVISLLIQHYSTYGKDEQETIYSLLLQILSENDLPFLNSIRLYSFLIAQGMSDRKVLQGIMRKLLSDGEWINYHHTILFNTLFFISRTNIEVYPGYHVDKRKVFRKLCNAYQQYIELPKTVEIENKSDCIVIIANQLLLTNHSPTLVTLELAKHIARIHSESRIVIIAEDTFHHVEPDLKLPWIFSSGQSLLFAEEHKKHLQDTSNIEILYAQSTDSKSGNIARLVKQVMQLNPKLIYTSAELSITCELLYPYYPVVYLSYGTVIPAGSADVYMFQDPDEATRENSIYGTISVERIGKFTGAINLPTPKSVVRRSDYGLQDTDFVLVTVGNRLGAEIGDEFADTVISFLTSRETAKWLIVGPQKIKSVEERHSHLLDRKIVKVDYEWDLPALYEICDVFLNPVRHGGGTSVILAMKAGLPVVISSIPSDGLVYVGIENSVGDNLHSFVDELERLYDDVDYRKRKGQLMKERLSSFTAETFLDELRLYSAMARKSFERRSMPERG